MKKQIVKITARPSRPGMVGDGFRVFNYVPSAVDQRSISPFLMLDFNPEFNFGPSPKPLGVDVHPHKGFETVTIAYKGSVQHADSSGGGGVIAEGEVQWMTAGSGILHKEFHEEQFSKKGGAFEMVQLWVNLPAKDKNTPPHYQALAKGDIEKVVLEDGKSEVNIIAGDFNGIKGPAKTFTPVNLFNIVLAERGSVITSTPANHNTALLVIDGSITVNGEKAEKHSFVHFDHSGEDISITAESGATVLLLSGEPINEPIASYGPFVMNTEAEIRQAILDYQQGKFGVLN